MPLTGLVLLVISLRAGAPTADPTRWAAFGYLASVSMFLGFFAWYRGLAIGPVAQVAQVQLLQPVLSIAWAALLLRETVPPVTVVGALVVPTCATVAVRARLRPRPATPRG